MTDVETWVSNFPDFPRNLNRDVPMNYGVLQEQYNAMVQENRNYQDLVDQPLQSYKIQSGPIVLQDPVFDNPSNAPNIPKFPYLKRGQGLARFNMDMDQLKKGPPELYKKKEFKSFLKKAEPKPLPKVKKQPKPSFKCSEPEKKQFTRPVPPKAFNERKYTLQPVKNFDDEVIPTLKNNDVNFCDAFEVPIPNKFLRRPEVPVESDIPKTPMKSLRLNPDYLPEEEDIINQLNTSLEEVESDGEQCVEDNSPTVRRLSYTEPDERRENIMKNLPWDVIATKAATRYDQLQRESQINQPRQDEISEEKIQQRNQLERKKPKELYDNFKQSHCRLEETGSEDELPQRNNQEIAEAMQRKGLTDNFKHTQRRQEETCFRIDVGSDDELPRRSKREIAEAMKRKGLTDNVKKQLAWNVSPRKRKPIRIVKKIKIKKPKFIPREKLTVHEMKDRMDQLEQVKEKLLQDLTKIKKSEKEFFDKKQKLDKDRKELERLFDIEREELADERIKLVEDQKKFKREKAVFEKYLQETKNLPSREERDEIRKLKEELEKLKETQRTKDSRYGALQAQLRNRVLLLEKENSELRAELEEANKVTTKRVRFDTAGKVTGKVIDAINKQLDTKLKPNVRPAARETGLRRSKSSGDLKAAVTKTRPRGRTVDVVSDRRVRERADANVNVEIIDLLGDAEGEYLKKNETDSGIDTRAGSEESSTRSDPPIDKPEFQSSTYSALQEMRRRVGNLLGNIDEPATNNWSNSDTFRQTSESSSESRIPPLDNQPTADNRATCERSNGSQQTINGHNLGQQNYRTSRDPDQQTRSWSSVESSDTCATAGRGFPPSGDSNFATTGRGFPQSGDRSRGVLDVSDFGSDARPTSGSLDSGRGFYGKRSGSSICVRHGLPLVESNKISEIRWKIPVDRDVIRTEVGGGDVEEEELHTGVRRLWCGGCGACETTYRNRPGYRRTTSPDGSTMEEHPDGLRECRYKSGEITKKYPNGDKLLLLPNGDREFTTRGYKKLERPDGIIRTLYDDGRLETRYPGGRVRIKNAEGHLIMDTGGIAR